MGKKFKPRVIPEQDGRIIGTICLCQLTLVLSSVALVYLSVAVYAPSHRAFNSGYELTPVMCDTVNLTMARNCTWASCGEWCLTKTSGFCPQVVVMAREYGSNLTLSGCSSFQQISCPLINLETLNRSNCNKPGRCPSLTGVFNCKVGHCSNISEVMECHQKGEGSPLDVEKKSGKMIGNYVCHHGKCLKLNDKIRCEYYCPKIPTTTNNVYVAIGNEVLAARCLKAAASDPSVPTLGPIPLWDPSDGALLVSCYTFNRTADNITATDCVNGTVVPQSDFPRRVMNYTQFRSIWSEAMPSSRLAVNRVPRGIRLLPDSSLLSVHSNVSRLYINLKACVNTLRGECRQFVQDYGGDGANHTARSRYPCFYKKDDPSVVLARFDLEETWRELLIASIIPVIFFVISLTTLIVMTRNVKVGDDAKLRCLSLCSSRPAREPLETPTPT